eukprot:321314-Prorocentrum_lima.AAC.1
MTSSLVGSEMCIRDRVKPRTGTSDKRLSQDDYGPEEGSWASSLGDDTVSYTHLTLPTICSV